MRVVTGETIQEIADHSIVLDVPSNGLSDICNKQLANTKCKYTRFNPNDTITVLPDEIMNAKSLFVYTHILDFFFAKIFPLLKQPFVLVTHNSDFGVGEKYRPCLDDPKIIKWYAQNVECFHDKLIPLPIGLANSQWPHGDLSILQTVGAEHPKKVYKVTKCFDPTTAPHRRMHVDIATTANGIPMSPKKPYIDYLREIGQSIFTICPMGNEVDSHRVWESLYLGSIPIVADCPHFRGFTDLPMMAVVYGEHDNWNHITIPLLDDIVKKMVGISYNVEKLVMGYWEKRIKEGV